MRKSLFIIPALCLSLWAANTWALNTDATFALIIINDDTASHGIVLEGPDLIVDETLSSNGSYGYEASETAYFLDPTDYNYYLIINTSSGEETLCYTEITVTTSYTYGLQLDCSATSFDTDSCTLTTGIGVYGTTCQAVVTIND